MSARLRPGLPELLVAVAAVGALVIALWAFPALRLQSHTERDVSQERLDQAIGPLGPNLTVGQTFVSRHAGLSAVEVLLVVYDQARVLPDDAQITMTLERQDVAGPPLAVTLSASGIVHNQRVVFSFTPLLDSEDVPYTLYLHCPAEYGIGCWQTSSEAYAEGNALRNGEPLPGDLYFATSYRYSAGNALADLATAARRGLPLLPALLLLLLLPGAVLLLYLWPRRQPLDTLTRVSLAVALSLAFWPLLLLWSTTLGARLRGAWVWVPVAVLAVAGVVRYVLNDRAAGRLRDCRGPRPVRTLSAAQVALAIVLLGVCATRILQARGLIVPPWVDSLHHTVVTRLIAEQGLVPTTGEPYLQLAAFHYHFGFQTNAALLMALTGMPAHRAVLVLGQVLNVAAVLGAGVLAVAVSGRRWAGVAAVLVAGLVSMMPAYYLSWGRYTQLAGMVILPFACLVAHRAVREGAQSRGLVVLAGVLAAGLALVHYRVFVLFVLYTVVDVGLAVVGRLRSWRATGSVLRGVLAVGALAAGLALPWAWRLLERVLPNMNALYGGWESPEGYNAFPTVLLQTGWTEALLVLAAVGAGWGLLRRRAQVVGLALWVGLWYVAANLRLVGLADAWLLNNASAFIALWLPVSVLIGWLLADVLALGVSWLARHRVVARLPWRRMATSAAVVMTVAATTWFGWQTVDVVNPVTVLLYADDLQALEWARTNTPQDALFLVNSRLWEGDIHTGTDGGWWLPLLADRQVTMPSILYHQGLAEVRESVNSLATLVEQTPSVDDPALLARLRAEGVTHVFVGARAGRLLPNELDASAHFRAVFEYGAARIYEFVP